MPTLRSAERTYLCCLYQIERGINGIVECEFEAIVCTCNVCVCAITIKSFTITQQNWYVAKWFHCKYHSTYSIRYTTKSSQNSICEDGPFANLTKSLISYAYLWQQFVSHTPPEFIAMPRFSFLLDSSCGSY